MKYKLEYLQKYIKQDRYLYVGIVALCFLYYFKTLFFEFVWDDFAFIVNADYSHFSISDLILGKQSHFETGVYRPVRNLIHWIFYSAFGANPMSYHFFGILIHSVVSCMVYWIGRLLKIEKKVVLLATLFFVIHPLHLEAVVWVTSSFDLISFIFLLAAFGLYLKENKKNLSIFFAMVAIFSNELSIVLPLIICWHKVIVTKKGIKQSLIETQQYIYIALGYLLMRYLSVHNLSRMPYLLESLDQTILLIFSIYGRYLQLLMIPWSQSINHYFFDTIPSLFYLDLDITQKLPIVPIRNLEFIVYVGFIVGFFLSSKFLKKSDQFFFFSGWILISLLPVLQFIPQPIIFSERYSYLSSIGFCFVVAKTIMNFKQPLIRSIVILLITSIYTFQFFNYVSVWQNPKTLRSSVLSKYPTSASSLNSLGAYYGRNGQSDKAIEYYTLAINSNTNILLYQRNLMSLLEEKNDYERLIPLYQLILEKEPNASIIKEKLRQASLELEKNR